MKFTVASRYGSYTTDKDRKNAIHGLKLMIRLGRMAATTLRHLEEKGHYDGIAPMVTSTPQRPIRITEMTGATTTPTPHVNTRLGSGREPRNFAIQFARFSLPMKPSLDWLSNLDDLDVQMNASVHGKRAHIVIRLNQVHLWTFRYGTPDVESRSDDPWLNAAKTVGAVNVDFDRGGGSIDSVFEFRLRFKEYSMNSMPLDEFARAVAETLIHLSIDSPHEAFELRDMVFEWLIESGKATDMLNGVKDFVFKYAMDDSFADAREGTVGHVMDS